MRVFTVSYMASKLQVWTYTLTAVPFVIRIVMVIAFDRTHTIDLIHKFINLG